MATTRGAHIEQKLADEIRLAKNALSNMQPPLPSSPGHGEVSALEQSGLRLFATEEATVRLAESGAPTLENVDEAYLKRIQVVISQLVDPCSLVDKHAASPSRYVRQLAFVQSLKLLALLQYLHTNSVFQALNKDIGLGDVIDTLFDCLKSISGTHFCPIVNGAVNAGNSIRFELQGRQLEEMCDAADPSEAKAEAQRKETQRVREAEAEALRLQAEAEKEARRVRLAEADAEALRLQAKAEAEKEAEEEARRVREAEARRVREAEKEARRLQAEKEAEAEAQRVRMAEAEKEARRLQAEKEAEAEARRVRKAEAETLRLQAENEAEALRLQEAAKLEAEKQAEAEQRARAEEQAEAERQAKERAKPEQGASTGRVAKKLTENQLFAAYTDFVGFINSLKINEMTAQDLSRLEDVLVDIEGNAFSTADNEAVRAMGIKFAKTKISGYFQTQISNAFDIDSLNVIVVYFNDSNWRKNPRTELLTAVQSLQTSLPLLDVAIAHSVQHPSQVVEASERQTKTEEHGRDIALKSRLMLLRYHVLIDPSPDEEEEWIKQLGLLVPALTDKTMSSEKDEKVRVEILELARSKLLSLKVKSLENEVNVPAAAERIVRQEKASGANQAQVARFQKVMSAKVEFIQASPPSDSRHRLTLKELYDQTSMYDAQENLFFRTGQFGVTKFGILPAFTRSFLVDRFLRSKNSFVCAPHVYVSIGEAFTVDKRVPDPEQPGAMKTVQTTDVSRKHKFKTVKKEFVAVQEQAYKKLMVETIKRKLTRQTKDTLSESPGLQLVYSVSRCLDYDYVLLPLYVPGHSNFLIVDLRNVTKQNVAARRLKVIHVEPNGSAFGKNKFYNEAIQQVLEIANKYEAGIVFDTAVEYGAIREHAFHDLMGRKEEIGGGICASVNYFMLFGWIQKNQEGENVTFDQYRQALLHQLQVQRDADIRINERLIKDFIIQVIDHEREDIALHMQHEWNRHMKAAGSVIQSDTEVYMSRPATQDEYVVHIYAQKGDTEVKAELISGEEFRQRHRQPGPEWKDYATEATKKSMQKYEEVVQSDMKWSNLVKMSVSDRCAALSKVDKVRELSEGSFGVVLGAEFANGEKLAVKVYIDNDDWELALFGVHDDGSLEAWKQKDFERLVTSCRLTETVLVKCDQTCGVCQKGRVTVDACRDNLRHAEHFHAVMPLMSGSLDDFIKPEMSIQTRMLHIAPVVEDMSCVHKVGYAYTDMKLENMLYRTVGKDTSVRLADLGSLCKIGEPTPGTAAGKYCKVDVDNAKIIVHEFALSEEAAREGFEPCNPHTATFVNIFQDVVDKEGYMSTSYDDYMLCNDFTNQFSVVILLLDTLNIELPSFDKVAILDSLVDIYEDPAGYIKAENTEHTGDDAKPWLDLIERVWNACNEFKFYSTKPPYNRGTKKNYLDNIAKTMRALLS